LTDNPIGVYLIHKFELTGNFRHNLLAAKLSTRIRSAFFVIIKIMKAGTFYVVEDEQIVELTGKNRLTIKNTGKNPILIDSKKITASSYPITKTETFEVEINKLYMKRSFGW